MKGVAHYKKDGSVHKGGTHKMPNGETHTGKSHNKTSQKLFHFKDLPVSVKRKILRSKKNG
tara:strand:+ start:303 stop:485 length:183 start_codon:yes stop_codon:yes gene_type:complete